jgi:hypothetical protein
MIIGQIDFDINYKFADLLKKREIKKGDKIYAYLLFFKTGLKLSPGAVLRVLRA